MGPVVADLETAFAVVVVVQDHLRNDITMSLRLNRRRRKVRKGMQPTQVLANTRIDITPGQVCPRGPRTHHSSPHGLQGIPERGLSSPISVSWFGVYLAMTSSIDTTALLLLILLKMK